MIDRRFIAPLEARSRGAAEDNGCNPMIDVQKARMDVSLDERGQTSLSADRAGEFPSFARLDSSVMRTARRIRSPSTEHSQKADKYRLI